MKRDMSKKAMQERKIEQSIHKALSDLQVLTSVYMGEREIARGDTIPHEEVWKRFKEKYKFKLSLKSKQSISRDVKELIQSHHPRLVEYIIGLIELRDELFKRPSPKRYPSPLPNHL